MDIQSLQQQLAQFASDRDWDDYHSPKNLAMALTSEVGELVDIFQWMTEAESRTLSAEHAAEVAEEIADIVIYAIRLADKLDVDIDRAVTEKVALNAKKYPVELARGTAMKYNRLHCSDGLTEAGR